MLPDTVQFRMTIINKDSYLPWGPDFVGFDHILGNDKRDEAREPA